ncbi:MAG: bifunctional nuclease family protein [Candidatus Aenigmatarchaeota archaeon]
MRALIILFVAVVLIAAIIFVNSCYSTPMKIISTPDVSKVGYVPVDVQMDGTSIIFSADCYSISMEITDEQAYSIKSALEKKIVSRPLTHDIIKDMLEGFDFKILMIRIESYNDEIYYARIILQKGDKVLEMDSRPSDATAIAIRMDEKIYFSEDLLKTYGTKSC